MTSGKIKRQDKHVRSVTIAELIADRLLFTDVKMKGSTSAEACYRAVQPPSIDKQAPVMEAASSLHRWRTRAATSSTRTKRFVG